MLSVIIQVIERDKRIIRLENIIFPQPKYEDSDISVDKHCTF